MAGGHRVVVITGGSAGVGRATAQLFARRGCAIGLLARGRMGLEATASEIGSLGGKALAVPTDVADPLQVEAAAERVERELGPIDLWINNAMTSVFSPVMETLADEYRRVTEVTYLGVVHGTQAALRRMLPRNQGKIVQVGSALAFRSIPLQSAYCAAKHAVEGFTASLRCELYHQRSRVRVSLVHLPAVNTPQFRWVRSRLPRKARPVPPIFQPEVAAEGVAWAADHDVRDLLVGWPTVKAVWGNRIAPDYADRYLGRVGYDAQMTDEPEDTNRPDNLWQPVEGNFGAHGVFDRGARAKSTQLRARTHLAQIGLAALGLAGALGMALAAEMIGNRRKRRGPGPRRVRALIKV
jgi:NAD(P)-dependent dehydrogenase (short-subunit alcohol dehydrogenase family)